MKIFKGFLFFLLILYMFATNWRMSHLEKEVLLLNEKVVSYESEISSSRSQLDTAFGQEIIRTVLDETDRARVYYEKTGCSVYNPENAALAYTPMMHYLLAANSAHGGVYTELLSSFAIRLEDSLNTYCQGAGRNLMKNVWLQLQKSIERQGNFS